VRRGFLPTVQLDLSRPHIHASCPCGGTYEAGEFSVDGTPSQPSAIHSVPECRQFVELYLLDFLTWARLNGAQPLS
jgi:hypothetical protein